jgi:hypothetical protein
MLRLTLCAVVDDAEAAADIVAFPFVLPRTQTPTWDRPKTISVVVMSPAAFFQILEVRNIDCVSFFSLLKPQV